MGGRPSSYTHLIRMALLFAAGLASFLVVRTAFMPDGFGVYGHYRAGALDDNRALPLRFAGQAACAACHEDVGRARASGPHARVSCESCHGALAAHAADPGEGRATRPDARGLCIGCHAANRSKPRGFPQVVVAEHAPDGACSACHLPHNPKVS